MCLSLANKKDAAKAASSPDLVSLDNSEIASSTSSGSFNTFDSTAAEVLVDVNFGGKRRKMSRADSPKSSSFDVASLVEAIHREFEDSPAPLEGLALQGQGHQDEDSPSCDDDDFGFFDISEAAPQLAFPTLDDDLDATSPMPTLDKRPSGGSLGKRSRGLVRSQTVAIDLCLMG